MANRIFLTSWLAGALLVNGFADVGARAGAQESAAEEQPKLNADLLAGLSLRALGPAIASGRISDLVVHPERKHEWIVSAASGGVWKTENAGTTWLPIFDGPFTDSAGSYSIGCITMDPNNPQVLWLGTGENNSQRSVGYGDGVYKSMDGGQTWKHMGLPESEHIGRIVVDRRNSQVVYVAAQGPLWRAGGDRGLYKTVDGGENWEKVLEISEHTGVNEVWIQPDNPDVLIASSYQRRRHTWTLIDGGPESAIYRSADAGATWSKIEAGLPTAELGKIGLAVSPADPNYMYAIIESIDEEGGVFRSTDSGLNWEKRSDYVSGSPQYYNELVPDPQNRERVYSMDTWLHVTEDGGATFAKVPEKTKHVDNHALWIDPDNLDHLVSGCDGGVYETWDRGASWEFMASLPITQFYKIAVDNDLPFYNVYGGTQDNSTLGGPSRTTSEHGISNRDWYVTVGGDGFDPAVDPDNPDIVYSQWQYGGLVRYDRASGELTDIKPQPEADEAPPRWNWDSALLISPHSGQRLYYASQRIYRSNDRGNTWQPISDDLTRNLDRNKLAVMGKVWGVDTVAKNRSTSFFGTVVSLSESPLVEGLIYAGTDDGLIQITEDGGDTWVPVEKISGVPEKAYVADLEASLHDPDTVYAAIENHKSGDFHPYLLKSIDRGRSWTMISGNLPERGEALAIVEDHQQPNLLFAGTEFGLWTSLNGGGEWLQLKGGLPVVAVRDLEIQRRESDLVVGTFGRGIYVLDDYSPLRAITASSIEEPAQLFQPRSSWMYRTTYELGYRQKAFQGDNFYSADNPPNGAMLSYHLGETVESLQQTRRRIEEEAEAADGGYPDWQQLRAEDREADPQVVLTVRDVEGQIVRQLSAPVEAGLHRVAWDLRYAPSDPINLTPPVSNFFSGPPIGPLAAPGSYSVSLAKWQNGSWSELAQAQSFEIVSIGTATLAAKDVQEVTAFQRQVAALQRAVQGSGKVVEELDSRIAHLRQAALFIPEASAPWLEQIEQIESRIDQLKVSLTGDSSVSARYEPTPPSIQARLEHVVSGLWTTSSAPTTTQRRGYEIVAQAFPAVLAEIRALAVDDLPQLESGMEAAGAPWTPGRIPTWNP